MSPAGDAHTQTEAIREALESGYAADSLSDSEYPNGPQYWRDANAALDALVARLEQLTEALENTVIACLPLMPLNGSRQKGYRVNSLIHPTLVATVDEWYDAAQSIADAYGLLAAAGSSAAESSFGPQTAGMLDQLRDQRAGSSVNPEESEA